METVAPEAHGLTMEAQDAFEDLLRKVHSRRRRQGAANHFLHAAFNLLAAMGEGVHDHGEQPVQRLADGRRLARQIAIIGFSPSKQGAWHLAITMGGTRYDTTHSHACGCERVMITMSAAAPVFAQRQGGIIKLSHFDSPASMSIHEESTSAADEPMMGVFNNLVMYQAGRAANQPAIDRSRSRHRLVVERGRDRADLPASPRRQMA